MERIFKAIDRHGAEIEFELIEPTDLLERESEMEYRKAYSAAIKEGILPREKMRELFKKNGIWSDEDDKQFSDLVRELSKFSLALEDAVKRGDDNECINIAGEMSKFRVRMLQLFMVQQTSYMQSCEGYAEILRLESLMASCVTIKANKQRYWKNYKDYVIERDHNEKSTVYSNVILINNSLLEKQRDSTIDEYPEQKWLKKIHTDIIEQARESAKQLIVQRTQEVLNAEQVASATTSEQIGDKGAGSNIV